MTNYECECTICKSQRQIRFDVEPYPQYGDEFPFFCQYCDKETSFTRILTRKTRAELRRKQEEQELRNTIIERCDFYGFQYRFLYQSVIVTTNLSDWCFDYHQKSITLYHESTYKINFATGDYAKAHMQFCDKSMKPSKVIDYIASHDAWRTEQNKLRKK